MNRSHRILRRGFALLIALTLLLSSLPDSLMTVKASEQEGTVSSEIVSDSVPDGNGNPDEEASTDEIKSEDTESDSTSAGTENPVRKDEKPDTESGITDEDAGLAGNAGESPALEEIPAETQSNEIQAVPENEQETAKYQFFKNGEPVGEFCDSVDGVSEDYDGYIKIDTTTDTVTVTPFAKEGYEFMMLCLIDESGNVSTPFTRDYKKSVSDGKVAAERVTADDSVYSFIVNVEKATATDFDSRGTVYSSIPSMKAYFELKEGLLNESLLKMEPFKKQQGKENAVISWLGAVEGHPDYGTLHVGVGGSWGAWNGVDCNNGDYVTYYAGYGKAFHITAMSFYSRLYFTDNRFGAVMEGSDDGENFTEIGKTEWGIGQEKESVKRTYRTVDSQYPYIRFRATTNNADISLLKVYGDIVDTEVAGGVSYVSFNDGNVIGTYGTKEAMQNDKRYADCDGYIETKTEGTIITVTPYAKEGYEFMMLSLTDENGNVSTPFTKDYKKAVSEGKVTAERVNGENGYYSFVVDETKETATDFEPLGTAYSSMPSMEAYFESKEGLLTESLLTSTPFAQQHGNEQKPDSVISWLGAAEGHPYYGTLHVGIGSGWGAWDGVDCANGDYMTYFAGEGKAYKISEASIYSRLYFTDNRFDAVIEGSNDGIAYHEILKTQRGAAQEKNSIKRMTLTGDDEVEYSYIRFKATSNNADISLLKVYGEIVNTVESGKSTYHIYKDGKEIESFESEEAMKAADSYANCEGYVVITQEGKEVKVKVFAKEGYNFMLLNLRDENGYVSTPLSRNYVKTGNWTQKKITDGNYSYAFEVNEKKETPVDGGDIGSVFKKMPTIEVYFDADGELINDELMTMEPIDVVQAKADKSITCWLDMDKATLNSGDNKWDGQDIANGDYVTYYAGEGKAFHLSGLNIYSRRGFTNSRFTAVIEASNDGDSFTTIFSTENGGAKEQYSVKRTAVSQDLKFRILRIRATGNNTDVNILKLYGSIKDTTDAELSKLVSPQKPIDAPQILAEVPIKEITSKAGFVHPGVGITAEQLRNIQEQVKAQKDPWYTYYLSFVSSSYASRNFACQNSVTDEHGNVVIRYDSYDSQGFKNIASGDGERAFTQALMYVITGDEVYRSNAMRIIRIWEQMDPAKYKYFTDAHIHTGWGLFRMIQAAEVLRYTDCVTEEWKWTETDTEKFIMNVVNPTVSTFIDTNEKFMNQHNFPLNGTIAAAIFKDDAADYAKRIEWTTVNKDAPDVYWTGSIKWLYRYMTENEETGEPLDPKDYHVQLVEMGRDLAHAGDDVGTMLNLARMIDSQGTKVDPENGTVSNAENAVTIYEFLDHRILRATDYFCQSGMGYEVNWTPARTSKDNPPSIYKIVSDEYQGRMYSVGIADIYYVYRYKLGYTEEQLAEIAPYYLKAFKQKLGTSYYVAGAGKDTDVWKESADGAWLYIPEALDASDATGSNIPVPYPEDSKYICEIERQFSIIDGTNKVVDSTDRVSVKNEGDTSYIQVNTEKGSGMFAVYNFSLINRNAEQALVAMRVRSTGNAVLEIQKGADTEPFHTLAIPNTNGKWQNIVFDMSYNTVSIGQYPEATHLMYFKISGDGAVVDCDHININADKTLSVPEFDNVSGNAVEAAVVSGEEFTYDFHASDSNPLHVNFLNYELQGEFGNAVLNPATGAFSWTPTKEDEGVHDGCVIVSDGSAFAVVSLRITVSASRLEAVKNTCKAVETEGWKEKYLSVTVDDYLQAKDEAIKAASSEGTTKEEYDAALNKLLQAIGALQEKNPLLNDGSINFPKMINGTSLGEGKAESLVDNNSVTFTGDLTMKYFTLDFGALYRVKVSKFAAQPRNIWPRRTAGCVIMGSVDGETWDKLTEPFPCIDDMVELEVAAEYQNKEYRYFKVTSLWPDTTDEIARTESILSLGEFRIWGERQEVDTKIREVSISTDAKALTNHIGDTYNYQSYPKRAMAGNSVTLQFTAKQELEDVSVVIAGMEAVVEKADALHYKAEVILTEDAAAYNASKNAIFSISYSYRDGSGRLVKGEDFTKTTDGTEVFISSDENAIELRNRYYYSSWNDDGTVHRTQEQIAAEIKNITDNNTLTVSDARHGFGTGSGAYIIIDFGEGRGVSLSRCEVLPRFDKLDRSTGTYLQGSNDYDDSTLTGTWNDITKRSLYSTVWQGMEVTDHRYYRYIRFINDGNWFGNISELKLYGIETDEVPETTPGPTPSPTPSPNPTEKPTPSPEVTKKPTPSPEVTEKPTSSPEVTENPTPSANPTEKPMPSPEATEKPAPSPEVTEKPTPSPEVTEKPTPSPEVLEKPTPSANPTEKPMPSSEATEKPTPSPEVTEKPTQSAKPSETKSPAQGDGETKCQVTISDTIPESVMISEVKDATGCETVEELKSYMQEQIIKVQQSTGLLPGIPKENTVFFEVAVQISPDGGITWMEATESNFPVEGVDVLIPYPTGVDKENNDFIIGHLIVLACNGQKPGTMEYIIPEKKENGLQAHVYSASPFIVAWKPASAPAENTAPEAAKDATEQETVNSPKTSDPFKLWILLTLCVVSAGGMAVTYYMRKKNRENEQ